MEIQETSSGVLLAVRINPASGMFRLHEKSGRLMIDVNSKPEKDMANREILMNLGKMFGTDIRIVKGHKSRDKIILVKGASLEGVKRILKS
jgi:uncharacterized protein (TIGR00251 family)